MTVCVSQVVIKDSNQCLSGATAHDVSKHAAQRRVYLKYMTHLASVHIQEYQSSAENISHVVGFSWFDFNLSCC